MKTAYDIGKAMTEAPQVPLNKEMIEMLIGLLNMELTKAEMPDAAKTGFMYQVIHKRCVFHEIPVTDYTKILLSLIADRPAVAILYVAALHFISKENKREVDIHYLVNYFGMGFPGEKDLHRIWLSQKDSEGTNLLDIKESWNHG